MPVPGAGGFPPACNGGNVHRTAGGEDGEGRREVLITRSRLNGNALRLKNEKEQGTKKAERSAGDLTFGGRRPEETV